MADRIGNDNPNTLDGTLFDDFMDGKGGNDTLNAKSGDDILIGGTGADKMFGGLGTDDFRVIQGDLAAGEIYDGGSGTDTLRITTSGASFNGDLTSSKLTSIERITFVGSDAHLLRLSAAQEVANPGLVITASAGSEFLLFDLTTANASLNLSDVSFINWDDAKDTVSIVCGAGSNSVTGTKFDDFVQNIGTGDSVNSGDGNDDLDILTGDTPTAINGGNGTDTLKIFDETDLTGTNFTGIERLDLRSTTSGQNPRVAISASEIGGGIASDAVVTAVSGREGLDIIMGNDTNVSTSGMTFANFDFFFSIAIRGDDDAENMTGNAASEQFHGEGGVDLIQGMGGTDFIDGGTGADVMIGGAGNDDYFVDDTGDVAAEIIVGADPGGLDRVFSTVTHTLTSMIENLTLQGNAEIEGTGNTLANTLTGNSAANTLRGLGGADNMHGGLGADTVFGGGGKDTFDYNSVAESGPGALRDVIRDFQSGTDQFDLRDLDGNVNAAGVQEFVFDADGTLGIGEIRLREANGNTFLEGNADGDAAVEFVVQIRGVTGIAEDGLLV